MIILYLFVQTLALTCSKYSCPPVNYKFSNSSSCAEQKDSSVYLQSCATGLVCNADSGLCEIPTSEYEIGYPGDYCTSNSKCLSKLCSTGVCQGSALNGPCSDHPDCNPGLRCLNAVCVGQIPIGQTGCENEFDCQNNAGCNLIGSTGTCVEYLSQPIGAMVSDCNGGQSDLCKTSECSKMPIFGLMGRCKMATQSIKSIPTSCSSNLDCTGTDGVHTYTGECSCGFNGNGTAFCSPFSGDLPGLKYYSTWKDALNATIGKCNTMRRFDDSCLGNAGYLQKVSEATWGYLNYSFIQNNDLCVRDVLTSEYYGVSHGAMIGLMFSLLVLG